MAAVDRDIIVQSGTQTRASFEMGQSFVLNLQMSEIVNYSRWGHDLIVHLSSGANVRIDDFFLRGAGFHHLAVLDGVRRVEVDFSHSIDLNGDGIEDQLVNLRQAGSGHAPQSLRYLLAGVAVGVGAVGAAIAADGDDDGSGGGAAATFPRPAVLLVDSRIKNEGEGFSSGVATNDTKPHLIGRGVAGATISLRINGGDPIEIIVGDDGSWHYDFPDALDEADYRLQISHHNDYQRSEDIWFDFTIDITAPDAPQLSEIASDVNPAGKVENGLTNDPTPIFSGKSEAYATINIYVEIEGEKQLYGRGHADKDGQWQVELSETLKDGKYNITITATDLAGNESAAAPEIVLEVDATPPPAIDVKDVAVYGDPDDPTSLIVGDTTMEQKFSFKGNVSGTDIVKIGIYDNAKLLGYADVDAQGDWIFTFEEPLEFGHYNFAFQALDAAGNGASWSAVYRITVEDPVTSLSSALFSASSDAMEQNFEGALALADPISHQADYASDNSLISPVPIIF